MTKSSFVYVIYIRTTLEKLWDALLQPEFTRAYWFGVTLESEWTPGGMEDQAGREAYRSRFGWVAEGPVEPQEHAGDGGAAGEDCGSGERLTSSRRSLVFQLLRLGKRPLHLRLLQLVISDSSFIVISACYRDFPDLPVDGLPSGHRAASYEAPAPSSSTPKPPSLHHAGRPASTPPDPACRRGSRSDRKTPSPARARSAPSTSGSESRAPALLPAT